MDRTRPWIAFGAEVLVAAGAVLWHRAVGAPSLGFSVTLPLWAGVSAVSQRLGVAAFGTAVPLSVWTAGGTTASLGADLLNGDRTAVCLSALLVAVFGGDALAKAATGPVRREIEALEDSPERAAAMEFAALTMSMAARSAVGLPVLQETGGFLGTGRAPPDS